MIETKIDWDKPWEVYSEYLPEKTNDQLITFLMDWGLGLSHDGETHTDEYYVGVIPDYEGYCFNVTASTLTEALKGAMVKLFFSQESRGIWCGSAAATEETLKEYQNNLIKRLKEI